VFRILRQHHLLSYLLLVVLSVLLRLRFLLHPPAADQLHGFDTASFFRFPYLNTLYHYSPLVFQLVSLFIILGTGFYLNYRLHQEKLWEQKSLIPVFTLLAAGSISPSPLIISVYFFSALCLMLALLSVMKLGHAPKCGPAIFNVGVWIAIACCFSIQSLLLFPAFLLLLSVVRPFSLKELMTLFLGFFTMICIVLGFGFLRYGTHLFSRSGFVFPSFPVKTIALIPLVGSILPLFFLLLMAIMVLNQNTYRQSMAVRKKWTALSIYLVFSMAAGALSPVYPGLAWIITLLPLSILLSMAFGHNQEKKNTFTFYFLLLLIGIWQWFL